MGVSIVIMCIFKYAVFFLLPYLGPKMKWHHITAGAQGVKYTTWHREGAQNLW
jgi:hypothetical protein